MSTSSPKAKTSLELSTAIHVCNVIRRQVLDEFPNVTFNFIVCKSGDEAEALKLKQHEFERHPAGVNLLTHPDAFFPNSGPIKFPAVAFGKEKKILPFLAKEKILSSCFIFIDHFESIDDLRQHALMLVWHGLCLLQYKKEGKDEFYIFENEIIKSKFDEKNEAWHNMLADAFSAVFLELQGHKDYIKILGRRRSLMPMTAKTGWQPEFYPYPLVLDAAEIVYEEILNFSDLHQGRPMNQALEMTREIGETFDLNAMTQWSVFAKSAQEMAWIGTDRNVILGAAIHTSEDPYVRATAYMIAEFLNIEPILSIDPHLYNPFSDAEISERYHRKACEDMFLSVLSQAALRNDPSLFKQAAVKSHENLAFGKPVGWCGYALMQAAQAYQQGTAPIEDARQAFERAGREIPWSKIQDLNHMIIDMRRKGQLLTVPDLQALAAHSALGFPADAFRFS